jgi:hypothetical protein
MNLSLPEAAVVAQCDKCGVSISAIEPLPSGGTHLVCTTGDGAEEMRRRLQRSIIPGKVKRFPFFTVASSR